MPFEVFFDSPELYGSKQAFHSCGSSPGLLKTLFSYLDKHAGSLEEINIALYLFNNEVLDRRLVELSKKGIRINVFTIPIEGYDADKPADIIDLETGTTTCNNTKYGLARKFFSHHYLQPYSHYSLYFFPHIYLRSANIKQFSRGNKPYSLHTKSFLFKHKDGHYDMAIGSSNFAVRDLVKEENLLFIYDEEKFIAPAIAFFQQLQEHSTLIRDFYDETHSGKPIIPFENSLNNCCGFMAPFYKDSSLHIEDMLKQLMSKASKRIIVVGQHLCPINYEINSNFTSAQKENNREGFAKLLIEKANEGLEVSLLSQTFVGDSSFASHRFRKPINTKSFQQFYAMLQGNDNIHYYVNEHCHSKYIIIDDCIFVSTFNYTPTQFIYLDKVKIDEFTHLPNQSFEGIYSETGQFVTVHDEQLVNQYLNNFHEIIQKTPTVKVL